MNKPLKQISVVAAIIVQDGRVYATQRGYGDWRGWWEFPGGKIEPGECAEEALVREIREELDCGISVDEHFTTVEYDYPEFHLSMRCYLCRLEGQPHLLEHDDARWLTKEQLRSVKWLPADEGIITQLEKRLGYHEHQRPKPVPYRLGLQEKVGLEVCAYDTAKERWTIKVNGKEYSWTSFLDIINEKIYAKTQSEDKQLGFYFCKAEGNVISAERFVNKVLFYVYNDVFKDYGFDESFFNSDNGKLTFQGYYKTDGKINEEKVAMFLDNLAVEEIRKNVTED